MALPFDTLVCNLHNTANKFASCCYFLLIFDAGRNGFLAFGGEAWFMCALSYLSCGRFLWALGGVCVCVFDWPGSCLLAFGACRLPDVMAIKLVVCSEAA